MIRLKMKVAVFHLAAYILLFNSPVKAVEQTNAAPTGMVGDLGAVNNLVQVTLEYSNAVMAVVLPCFSDAAKRLNLPLTQPITYTNIQGIHFLPFLNKTLRSPNVSVLLKNGWVFDYFFGCVHRIENLRSYAALQDPDKIPLYYGEVKMTKEEAIQMARDSIKKLGIPLEDVFAEQEPLVTLPVKIETNTVPHYRIEWIDPRADGIHSVDIQINGNTKQLERIYFNSPNLKRPFPKIDVIPPPAPLDWPPVNPEYARQLIPMMFKAIDEYGQKLSLPIPRPLTTNCVTRIEIHNNEGWPHAEITLTNGWRFVYRHKMVNGYYAPGNFFDSDNRKIRINEFDGKWNLTTNQAIEVVRQAMAKSDYPTNNVHMDFAPSVYKASVATEHIPRLRFEWYYSVQDELQSRLEAEVNADNGKLESLYYDDKAYWGSRPPIDVPISVSK